jgi:hypothetical protein
MVDPNASWTAVHRGKVLLSFGIRTMTRNVGEAWLMPGKDISRYSISVVRCARKLFDDLLQNKGFCRIQVGVMLDNDIALRFAKSLGFEVEGIMRNFGSPGASCALMSRISDHGISQAPVASASPSPEVTAVQERAEQRAEASERQEAEELRLVCGLCALVVCACCSRLRVNRGQRKRRSAPQAARCNDQDQIRSARLHKARTCARANA